MGKLNALFCESEALPAASEALPAVSEAKSAVSEALPPVSEALLYYGPLNTKLIRRLELVMPPHVGPYTSY